MNTGAKIDRSLVVSIVGNGALAGPVADGRLIPVLILDTSRQPRVAELIRVRKHLKPGEATAQWVTSRDNEDHVGLLLNFTHPIEVEMLLLFSIEHEGILVDTMLASGAIYLQSGRPGDRLKSSRCPLSGWRRRREHFGYARVEFQLPTWERPVGSRRRRFGFHG